MYKYLLFDADNTLLDFNAGEKCALKEALASSPLEYSEKVYIRYHHINDSLWKKLEKGEVTRERLKIERFEVLLNEYGFDGAFYGKAIDDVFLEAMTKQARLIDGAIEALSYLSQKYELYLVTNATARIQKKRLAQTDFHLYFRKYYISEEIGVNKPDKAFFDYVISDIGDNDRSKYLVVGDSLTSDIKGAINSGLDSCYFDRDCKGSRGYSPTYTIKHLLDLIELL